jgi:hypothetical protein
MSEVSLLLDRLLDEDLASTDSLIGCSEVEIAEIMADQRVNELPAAYLCYLRRIGHGAGPLLEGTDAFFPKIIGLKADAEALFAETASRAELSPDAFVFAMHQGYQAFWFPTVNNDPEVLMFEEGRGICKRWKNFCAYLKDMIAEIDRR